MIDIKFNEGQLKELENKMKNAPKEVERATKFAISRTMQMTKTKLVKNARETYTVDYGDLTGSLSSINFGSLGRKITSKGSVIGLDHFQLSPKTRTSKGQRVTVSVKKGSNASLGDTIFIPYHSGFLGAFQRLSSNGRLPIERKMGPSAPQMIGNQEKMPLIDIFVEQKLNERFMHELNRLL